MADDAGCKRPAGKYSARQARLSRGLGRHWLRRLLLVGLAVSVLPAAAFASTTGYQKTMQFKAKQCQARVRDLPDSARLDPDPGADGLDKGQLIYGKASRNPSTLSFECVYGQFSGESLSWVIKSGSSPCWMPNAPPSARSRPYYSGPCTPWPFTHVPGTNVDIFTLQACGAAGGGSGRTSGCGPWLTDYVLTLHGAWIKFDLYQKSSSAVPWIVTMLQHSTFHVERGAGAFGNINPRSPQDWTLPNNWLCDSEPGSC